MTEAPFRLVSGRYDRPPVEGGREILVNGLPKTLFTSGELAAALNRKPSTIRRWEREGILPKATYSKPGAAGDVRGRRRFYSQEQVDGLVRLAFEEGFLDNPKALITHTRFAVRARELFKELAAR